jgi:23S rRNA (uracil1939-C5)-methyltransferase
METRLSKNEIYEVTVEKIVPEGKSLAHIDGKAIFITGGFPAEIVKVQVYKNKKSYSEARLVEIVKSSPIRIKPMEEHYLICSPWQVLPYEKQVEYKKQILAEAFLSQAAEDIKIDKFYESEEKYGYRTKLEFSFTENEKGKIALAFHKRGVNNEYEVISGCKLGSERMNAAAQKITDRLNTTPGIVVKGLKSLVIREGKTTKKIIAVLYYKFKEFEINMTISDLDGLVDGLFIAYSTIKSPMSVITELKHAEGDEFLEEKILGATIRYPYDGFFQNNLPIFEEALREIREATPTCNRIIEIYSGTGSIGFNLADKAQELVGIEIVPSAVRYAGINKELNKITNYTEIELPDHKIQKGDLENTDVLVLDPPRAGLHPKTVNRILEALPAMIIYLSCNPVTQARDYNDLKSSYKITRICGFDFYPNTLHMESLLILERK